jgi:hypothetical protein
LDTSIDVHYRYQVARVDGGTGWRIFVTSAGLVNFRRLKRLTCHADISLPAIPWK